MVENNVQQSLGTSLKTANSTIIKLNTFLAFMVVGVLITFASLTPTLFSSKLPLLLTIFTLLGLSFFIVFPSMRRFRLGEKSEYSLFSSSSGLLIIQIALFFISFIFFFSLESMTQMNPRLPSFEKGLLIKHLATHWISLGLVPWLSYSLMGIGLAFFSIRKKTQPLFSEIIVHSSQKSSFYYFLRNYLRVATEAIMFAPFIWLLILSIVWLCESLNGFFGYPSLFELPFRSISIFALLIVIFYKSHGKLMNWALERRMPLGGVLLLYCLTFTFFVFWLHGLGSHFTLGLENTTGDQIQKSIWITTMSESTLNTRLTLLIWSWWGIWTPWMASMIARLSLGKSVLTALLMSLILPIGLFLGVHFFMTEQNVFATGQSFITGQNIIEHYWMAFYFYGNIVWVKGAVGGALLLFILIAFAHMQTRADISRGGMLDLSSIKIKPEPMKKWINMLIIMVACYFPGVFMLGWLPMQIINTLASTAMLTIVFCFVLRLIAQCYRRDPS